MRNDILAAFALGALVVLGASPAFPCSPIQSTLEGTSVPATLDTNVALNTLVTIHVLGTPPAFTPQLVDDRGAESAPPFLLDGELLSVVPFYLEANRRYTLSFRRDDAAGGFGGRQPIVFTTGEDKDDVNPTIADVTDEPTVVFDGKDGLGAPVSSCGPQGNDFYFVTVKIPEASDDRGLAGFRLLRVDENGERTVRAVALVGERDVFAAKEIEPGTATYVVEAFDAAGNVAETSPFTVELVQPLLGCSATHARSSSSFAAALLFFVGLLTVRRRR